MTRHSETDRGTYRRLRDDPARWEARKAQVNARRRERRSEHVEPRQKRDVPLPHVVPGITLDRLMAGR